MRCGMLLALLPVVVGLGGCSEMRSVDTLQERVITDATPDQVLTAAASLLQREFGRIKVDAVGQRIDTAPAEFTTQRESGTVRDLYRGRSTMRRIAHFSVGRSHGQTVARLRVDLERRDTERQVVMQPRGYRLSDTPGQETPIDADAATSQEQNMVWTRVRRDRKLERALLEELQEQFARLSSEPEAAEVAEPPTAQPPTGVPAPEKPD